MFGDTAVAGYAVISRLEFMVLMMPLAIGTALEPLVAQNWGADLRQRAGLALKYARRAVAFWGLTIWLVFSALRWPLAHWLVDEPALVDVIVLALLIRPLGFVSGGVTTASTSAPNAIGRAPMAAQVSALFSLALLPLCGYVGGSAFGLGGVFGGTVLASWVATSVAVLFTRRAGLVVLDRDIKVAPGIQGP
jgi:Na+-driven multidrug efflux pump